MTSQELPREVKQYVLYLGNDALERFARKLPIDNDGQLREELRRIAVDHNVEVRAVHDELLNVLTLMFEPDDLDRLKGSSLHFLVTRPLSAE